MLIIIFVSAFGIQVTFFSSYLFISHFTRIQGICIFSSCMWKKKSFCQRTFHINCFKCFLLYTLHMHTFRMRLLSWLGARVCVSICLNGPFALWTSTIHNISALWPINWNSIVHCRIDLSFKMVRPIVCDDRPTYRCIESFFGSFSSVFVVKTFRTSDHLQIPITINCLKHVLSARHNATTTWNLKYTMGHDSIWGLKFWMALETNEPNL